MATGYKLFKQKNGKLYPLYVLANEETPIGVWLDAKSGPRTKKGKVKSRLGELAYRPGWHINDGLPYVNHIYTIHNGERYLKDGCVWCEVEYRTDCSYEEEANAAGWKNGKWSPVRAQLDYLPKDGYYRYKTNPNMDGAWIIAGEMRVVRVMDDNEVEQICKANGYKALKRWIA